MEALRQLIVDHHQAFVANLVAPGLISDATRERLSRLGLIRPEAKTVEDAYILGIIAAKAPAAGETMTYKELRAAITREPIPLSYAERAAINVAQTSAGQYITGLANKVAGQVAARIIDAAPGATEAEAYIGQVQNVTANAVRDRKTVGQIKSDLGWATGDWTRNLERVANTELAMAMSAGTAAKAVRDFGADVLVYKLHADKCCAQCRRLWIVRDSEVPRVYKLAELEANGTNVGRKAKEWLPTVSVTHPNCRCVLVPLPPGMILNSKGKMVASGIRKPKKSPP